MAPNGMMQVWTGLLFRVEDEAQLAYVIGHESATTSSVTRSSSSATFARDLERRPEARDVEIIRDYVKKLE